MLSVPRAASRIASRCFCLSPGVRSDLTALIHLLALGARVDTQQLLDLDVVLDEPVDTDDDVLPVR